MLCKHEVVGSIPSGSTNLSLYNLLRRINGLVQVKIEAALGMVQSAACRK